MDHDKWTWKEINKKQWPIVNGWEVSQSDLGGTVSITVLYSKIPGRKQLFGMGVDPGRNFGICTLDGREAWCFYGSLPKEDEQWRYGLTAFYLMSKDQLYHGKGNAIVEGAAYGKAHGQPALAYIRMGFLLGLHHAGHPVAFAPPATIRANALGSGRISGLEVWPELNHNAGDAIACALYAAGIKKEDVSGSHLRT